MPHLLLLALLSQSHLDIEALFKMLDKDKNGTLSRKETSHDSRLYKDFTRWDRDQNGRISLCEFTHYLNTRTKG